MSIYLIVVMLILPGRDAPTKELHQEFIPASSLGVCQNHAAKLAEAQRALHAGVIQSSGARVEATCQLQQSTT